MSNPGIMHVIKSVIAAGIGVQSMKSKEIDFQNASPMPYIVVGLIVTVLFIITLVFIAFQVTG